MKKIWKYIIVVSMMLMLIGCAKESESTNEIKLNEVKLEDKIEADTIEKLNIVTTNFATYDFLRQITKNTTNVSLTYLLSPGVDLHSYDPSPKDIININNADLFFYIGGEAESWLERTSNAIKLEENQKYSILDFVALSEEKEIEGAEEHEETEEHEELEYDEHIWTSPKNAIEMINKLTQIVSKEDIDNKLVYEENAKNYIEEIISIQKEIETLVANATTTKLVFGDKMPMQYFIDEFDLEVAAAFSGCSTETEPSVETIAGLIDIVNKDKIPVILYIELNSGKVANAIALETGTEVAQIQTMHNISKEDFENGESYVSLMKKNIDILHIALNN